MDLHALTSHIIIIVLVYYNHIIINILVDKLFDAVFFLSGWLQQLP